MNYARRLLEGQIAAVDRDLTTLALNREAAARSLAALDERLAERKQSRRQLVVALDLIDAAERVTE